MDYLPFDTVGLNCDLIDSFHSTYLALKAQFRLEPTGHIDFQLRQFESFRRYQSVEVKGSFAIKGKSDCYVLFVEMQCPAENHGSIPSSSTVYRTVYETWALAYLKKDFGRVLIRPETLADKILELVHPVEIDFKEDKAFSDTFYVLANDFDKANAAIDRSFRNAVMDIRHDNFVLEIVDHTLVVGDRKPVAPENSIRLAEFVSRVCSMC